MKLFTDEMKLINIYCHHTHASWWKLAPDISRLTLIRHQVFLIRSNIDFRLK